MKTSTVADSKVTLMILKFQININNTLLIRNKISK